MPTYNFKCDSCNHDLELIFSVKELIEYKKGKRECPSCHTGKLKQHIVSFGSKVEKSLDQFKMKAEEEVKEMAKRINAGDQELIKDIYGENPNPHKKRVTGVIDEN